MSAIQICMMLQDCKLEIHQYVFSWGMVFTNLIIFYLIRLNVKTDVRKVKTTSWTLKLIANKEITSRQSNNYLEAKNSRK